MTSRTAAEIAAALTRKRPLATYPLCPLQFWGLDKFERQRKFGSEVRTCSLRLQNLAFRSSSESETQRPKHSLQAANVEGNWGLDKLAIVMLGCQIAVNLKPLGDNILIKPITEKKTPSGILIPDTAKEKPQEGKVVAVGPGKIVDGEKIKPEVKKGDKVLYKKWGGNEIKLEGEEYLIVGSEDILGILG